MIQFSGSLKCTAVQNTSIDSNRIKYQINMAILLLGLVKNEGDNHR